VQDCGGAILPCGANLVARAITAGDGAIVAQTPRGSHDGSGRLRFSTYIIRRSRDKVAAGDIVMLGLEWTGRSRRAALQETIEFLLGRRRQAVVTLMFGGVYLIAVWVMPGQGGGELPLRISATVLPLLAFPAVFLFKVVDFSGLVTWLVSRQMNYWLVGAGISGLLCVGLIAGYFVDRSRDPIIWTWGPSSPVAIAMSSPDFVPRVARFQFIGENRGGDPVIAKRAFVKSDVDGRTVDLPIAGAIPGRRKFNLVFVLPSTNDSESGGMSVARFRAIFSKFTFVFEYEGGEPFTKTFDEAAVETLLTVAETYNREALQKAAMAKPGSS
jgi:hypothetical protein